MKSPLLLLTLLALATGIGFRMKATQGRIKRKAGLQISVAEIGTSFGSRATVLQFSTTFCSACRAAKVLISDVVSKESDVKYVEIDAESNLELVRKLDIRSTPTTLFLDKKGFEIARAVGAPKRNQITAAINRL
jgi:thiol-disulfide isomerase/thioredoxin